MKHNVYVQKLDVFIIKKLDAFNKLKLHNIKLFDNPKLVKIESLLSHLINLKV